MVQTQVLKSDSDQTVVGTKVEYSQAISLSLSLFFFVIITL